MSRVTQKRRQQRGGVLIASGRQGCIFKPAIPCVSPGAAPYPNSLSKIVSMRDATAEEGANERRRAFDPTDAFTTPLINVCVPEIPDDDLAACYDKVPELRAIPRESLRNLIYEDRGISLGQITDSLLHGTTPTCETQPNIKRYFYNLIHSFSQLLGIVLTFRNEGWHHNDLQAGNMVYDCNTNRWTIIDLGETTPIAPKTGLTPVTDLALVVQGIGIFFQALNDYVRTRATITDVRLEDYRFAERSDTRIRYSIFDEIAIWVTTSLRQLFGEGDLISTFRDVCRQYMDVIMRAEVG